MHGNPCLPAGPGHIDHRGRCQSADIVDDVDTAIQRLGGDLGMVGVHAQQGSQRRRPVLVDESLQDRGQPQPLLFRADRCCARARRFRADIDHLDPSVHHGVQVRLDGAPVQVATAIRE